MAVTAQQMQAFRSAVKAVDAGDMSAFGYWHFTLLVEFGGTGECTRVRDRIWRALRRCSANFDRMMYVTKGQALAQTEKRMAAEERARVRSGWTYGRRV